MAQKKMAGSHGRAPDERCACGRRVTPLAKRLQDHTPGAKRKCLTCLVNDREVKLVTL